MHDDVLSDSRLSDCRLMLNQEIVFHLVEPLLVQVFASDHEQRLST